MRRMLWGELCLMPSNGSLKQNAAIGSDVDHGIRMSHTSSSQNSALTVGRHGSSRLMMMLNRNVLVASGALSSLREKNLEDATVKSTDGKANRCRIKGAKTSSQPWRSTISKGGKPRYCKAADRRQRAEQSGSKPLVAL